MIHSTAIVAADADIGSNVIIEPFAVVEGQVEIGANTHIRSHAVVRSHTKIGVGNQIHEFAVVGGEPQSIGYRNEPTELIIGDYNTIREYVTISRGTVTGAFRTRIANHNYIMANSHIGHDCQIANHCVLTNFATLGGHVELGDYAFLGGFAMIHQFCRLGAHCMTGLNTVLRQDVAPYTTVNGNPARTICINSRGLSKRNIPQQSIQKLKQVYKLYFRKLLPIERIEQTLDEETMNDTYIVNFLQFVKSSVRGVVR